MGQEILKQQQELEERIRGFEQDDGEVGEETTERLKELDEAMRTWEGQNEGMMRELGGKVGLDELTVLTNRVRLQRFPSLNRR
jgi:lipase chaperone LimK